QYAIRDFEGMISKGELTRLVVNLKPTIDKYNKNSQYGPLSFFEVYTALAFVYFKQKKVDFAVLETGLGGRLDATNVVKPLVCAITPISYEHTQRLGNTLREIAREKAGIIKVQSSCLSLPVRQAGKVQSSIVITAPQEKEAMEVIRNRCKEVGAKLYEINSNRYPRFKMKLLGEHQQINAKVAVEVIKVLRFYGIKINRETMRKGLYNTVWPGRCEVIFKNPLVVLDGAQNVASATVLKGTIKENFQYKKLILVLGISNDKDIKGVCNELHDLADKIILTKANNPRATEPEVLAQSFDGKEAHKTKNVKEAQEVVKRIAKKEDLVLVTGSLFVVGEARKLF
ncbi:MAG: Mur ligase family protein, partial [Candidatus Omnitrophota bacterium]|nr:Mur ligase family protein [Candidatus Omnitrophota bacterium]